MKVVDIFLHSLGINAVAVGYDWNCFMFGIKYDDEEGVVEEAPDASALFVLIGPFHIIFILGGDE